MGHTIELVREFHEKFNHPVAYAPTVATEDLRVLRVKLIAEELAELCQALKVDLTLIVQDSIMLQVDPSPEYCGEPDLIEAADALGDLDYVVQGANLVFGFPAEAITREIHRSNMSKLGADGKPVYREDGKVLKGPSYSPPDIKAILEAKFTPGSANDVVTRQHQIIKRLIYLNDLQTQIREAWLRDILQVGAKAHDAALDDLLTVQSEIDQLTEELAAIEGGDI